MRGGPGAAVGGRVGGGPRGPWGSAPPPAAARRSAGGAERVVAALVERWPAVPLFTSAYLPDCTFDAFRRADVRTSFVQRFARDPNTVMRRVFPLMVPGFRSFDFSDYQVVLSSS